MKTKLVKYANDKCYGENYEKIEQCHACWVKNACFVKYRNRD